MDAALLGAADVLRHEIGAPTPACERPSRAATDAAVRAALPGSGFDRAYRFGARTPLDDLLAMTAAAPLTPATTLTPTPAPATPADAP